jgi:hypothetical protein
VLASIYFFSIKDFEQVTNECALMALSDAIDIRLLTCLAFCEKHWLRKIKRKILVVTK